MTDNTDAQNLAYPAAAADVDTSDMPAELSPYVRYRRIPVTELTAGMTYRSVAHRVERHLSVTKVARQSNYVVAEYLHHGQRGVDDLRVGQDVLIIAN